MSLWILSFPMLWLSFRRVAKFRRSIQLRRMMNSLAAQLIMVIYRISVNERRSVVALSYKYSQQLGSLLIFLPYLSITVILFVLVKSLGYLILNYTLSSSASPFGSSAASLVQDSILCWYLSLYLPYHLFELKMNQQDSFRFRIKQLVSILFILLNNII